MGTKHINLNMVAQYIATSAPGNLHVLHDLVRNRAASLGVTAKKAKALPTPPPVKEVTLKLAGVRAWIESVEKDDAEGKAALASILKALDEKLAA